VAKQIVFLGFAYHDQNMRLLADDRSLDKKEFIGTAYRMSSSDVSTIKHQIYEWENQRPSGVIPNFAHIDINNILTAAEIFNHYSKSL
jgi:hypothetical protein